MSPILETFWFTLGGLAGGTFSHQIQFDKLLLAHFETDQISKKMQRNQLNGLLPIL